MSRSPRQVAKPPASKRFRCSRKRVSRGHSLLEVLMGMGLTTALVIQVFMLNVLSRRLTNQANAQASAYLAIEQQLEVLRTQDWDSRVTVGNSGGFSVPAGVNGQFFGPSAPGGGMVGRYKVTQVSSTLQQASACVRWPNLSAPGKFSEACADTYFAKASNP